MGRVLVLGGGIAGMSAAMELMRDHEVTIVERRGQLGGKARTWTDPDRNVFREHSFRVFHDTYHNTFDTMRRVSIGGAKTIRDNLEPYVSREALFESYPKTWERYAGGVELSRLEKARNMRDALRLLRVMIASDARLKARYRTCAFDDLFAPRRDGSRGMVYQALKDMAQVEYSAERMSPDLKIMINFIEKHFMHGPPGLGWNALRGPTSDTFIEPWRRHLEEGGVTIHTHAEVLTLEYDRAHNAVTDVTVRDVTSGDLRELKADVVISAVPSDALLGVAPMALQRAAPAAFSALRQVKRVWNNGAIIYSSRPTPVRGSYYMWHPWRVAVTTYSWRWDARWDLARYGVGPDAGRIREIISYVICDWTSPGPHTGRAARDCSPDQIYEELCAMSEADPSVMPDFNRDHHVHPRDLRGEPMTCAVDEALIYDDAGQHIVANEDSLMHLPPGGWFDMPRARTPIDNFVLASTHCYNAFGCGDSMEGANETGRRAANAALDHLGSRRRVPVLEGRDDSPAVKLLNVLRAIDGALFRAGV